MLLASVIALMLGIIAQQVRQAVVVFTLFAAGAAFVAIAATTTTTATTTATAACFGAAFITGLGIAQHFCCRAGCLVIALCGAVGRLGGIGCCRRCLYPRSGGDDGGAGHCCRGHRSAGHVSSRQAFNSGALGYRCRLGAAGALATLGRGLRLVTALVRARVAALATLLVRCLLAAIALRIARLLAAAGSVAALFLAAVTVFLALAALLAVFTRHLFQVCAHRLGLGHCLLGRLVGVLATALIARLVLLPLLRVVAVLVAAIVAVVARVAVVVRLCRRRAAIGFGGTEQTLDPADEAGAGRCLGRCRRRSNRLYRDRLTHRSGLAVLDIGDCRGGRNVQLCLGQSQYRQLAWGATLVARLAGFLAQLVFTQAGNRVMRRVQLLVGNDDDR